jgi:hypothetical protein
MKYLLVYLQQVPVLASGCVQVCWDDPRRPETQRLANLYVAPSQLLWDPDRIVTPPWGPHVPSPRWSDSTSPWVEGLIPLVYLYGSIHPHIWARVRHTANDVSGWFRAAQSSVGDWNGGEFESRCPVKASRTRWACSEWGGGEKPSESMVWPHPNELGGNSPLGFPASKQVLWNYGDPRFSRKEHDD